MRADFNSDWTFTDSKGAKKNIFVPHDAMIGEERNASNPSSSNGAFFAGGNYTYEREFYVPDEWKSKIVDFEFEGVYQKAEVYINDKLAGKCIYGYLPFWIETKDLLHYGSTNKITVEVYNNEQPNCRWYSGSGIYRPVWMWVQEQVRILHNGVRITTLSHSPAEIHITTKHDGGQISIEILDSESNRVLRAKGDDVKLKIPNAKLWNAEHPYLYTCRVNCENEGKIIETRDIKFGLRHISWSTKGFFVNGENTLFKGGCVHHDNGVIGACSYEKSEYRRVRLLKESGYNALRSSHNPASSAMLRACDELGMYMMDETWDMWVIPKLKYDYSSDFLNCYKMDIETIVDRDYNHPSVIMYSIGNEVSDPTKDEGIQVEKSLVDCFHKCDPTRPTTIGFNIMIALMVAKGVNFFEMVTDENKEKKDDEVTNTSEAFNELTQSDDMKMNTAGASPDGDKLSSPCFDILDIAGYNYASERIALDPVQHPNRVSVGSETMPGDIYHNWELCKKYPNSVGDFMWTAWDYIGETGAGVWAYTEDGKGFTKPYPWLLGGAGVFDICGDETGEIGYIGTVWDHLKKPYICVQPVNHPGVEPYKSMWRFTDGLPSWTWHGCNQNDAKVEVYAKAHSIKLILNGKEVGTQKVEDQNWSVPKKMMLKLFCLLKKKKCVLLWKSFGSH